jgi:hypothetical protein
MTTYTSVQFIGYAIPSIPLTITDIGDPNSPGFVGGRYEGIDPAAADIDARIALAMSAVRKTLKSGAVDRSASTLKIFVMPEFSFRGRQGAYDAAEFTYFRQQFAKHVAAAAYKDWLFVTGTTVTTAGSYRRGKSRKHDLKARVRENLAAALADAWQYSRTYHDQKLASFVTTTLAAYTPYCHADPVYEVENRSYVVAGGPPDPAYPEGLSTRKKFESNEDFVLDVHGNALAEECAGYPPINEKKGENKRKAFDDYSIFTIKGIKFGVEVCLDHLQARLRRNRLLQNELVQIHLIPSSGMQIQEPSIVACGGGLVFNCDGQYDTLAPGSQPGAADSIWTGTASHRAHTQLTQVVAPCRGKNPESNTAVLTRPAARVTRVPITNASASKLYAYGAGEVHVYTSLPVPPPITSR